MQGHARRSTVFDTDSLAALRGIDAKTKSRAIAARATRDSSHWIQHKNCQEGLSADQEVSLDVVAGKPALIGSCEPARHTAFIKGIQHPIDEDACKSESACIGIHGVRPPKHVASSLFIAAAPWQPR